MTFEMTAIKIQMPKSALNTAQVFYQLNKARAKEKKDESVGLFHGQIQNFLGRALVGSRKYLLVRGVGYKFLKQNGYLSFQIGYSHQINLVIPSDIKLKLNRKSTALKFQNANESFLHGLLSTMRNYKKPDVYKGKGFRYKKDFVIRKEGKKKKTF